MSPPARDIAILVYRPLVGVARRLVHWNGSREDEEDIMGAGMIALVRCYDRYEEERGTQFSTYAVPSIVGAMMHWVREATGLRRQRARVRAGRRPVEFVPLADVRAATLADAAPGPEEAALAHAEQEEALEVIRSLFPRHPRWALAVFLVASEGWSQERVAREVGYSQMHVSRIILQAEVLLGHALPRVAQRRAL